MLIMNISERILVQNKKIRNKIYKISFYEIPNAIILHRKQKIIDILFRLNKHILVFRKYKDMFVNIKTMS